MQNLKIGHYTNIEKGTGLSVFLFDGPAVGASIICGSAPATHELAPLEPEMSVPHVHGLLLTGGSAFGLPAVQGVMQFLAEKNIGVKVPHGVVPIVPAAAIYDLAHKKPHPPTAEDAYQACRQAEYDNELSGQVGAGTGALVGKMISQAKSMSGGIGFSQITMSKEITVCAYVVVNAVGDIRAVSGEIIAGALLPSGEFADCEKYLAHGHQEKQIFQEGNSVLAAVFTNAKFTKSELKRIAKMSIAGIARSITPAFTCYDGDILFAFSLGDQTASTTMVGSVGAQAVRLAIMDAVKNSRKL